jgi:hypothetical protein
MERARRKARCCSVTQRKPKAADRNPIELEAHHLFDAASRPDLAALEDNLLVISAALHRNVHKWMGQHPRSGGGPPAETDPPPGVAASPL